MLEAPPRRDLCVPIIQLAEQLLEATGRVAKLVTDQAATAKNAGKAIRFVQRYTQLVVQATASPVPTAAVAANAISARTAMLAASAYCAARTGIAAKGPRRLWHAARVIKTGVKPHQAKSWHALT